MLDNLPIVRYAIRFRALIPMQLPPYAGSAFRGAFGHALKHLTCLTAREKHLSCTCTPNIGCSYQQLFEPPRRHLVLQQRWQDIAPPLVVEAVGLPQQLAAGEQATLHMVLIGEAAQQQLPLIRLAWQKALAYGIGSSSPSRGVQAELLELIDINRPELSQPLSHDLSIRTLTHLRLLQHSKWVQADQLTPTMFCWSVVRRYLSLAETYGITLPDEAVKAQLLTDCQQVTGTVAVRWQQWARYSNRQQQKMQMDGLYGHLQLHHVSHLLARLLFLGQWLHTGKGAVFGLGQYQLELLDLPKAG